MDHNLFLNDDIVSTLLNKARGSLESRLDQQQTEEDQSLKENLLLNLAATYRKMGLNEAALNTYRRLADALRKQDRHYPSKVFAEYMCALLARQSVADFILPASISYTPAPFLLIDDFLPHDHHQNLLEYAISRENEFTAGRVLTEDNTAEIAPTIRDVKIFCFPKALKADYTSRLEALVPAACQQLGVPLFQWETPHPDVLAYPQGFYRMHCDNDNKQKKNRVLSTVYYFHREPRPFTGGDLFLYDTDARNSKAGSDYTRIIPKNNSLLVFPSEYFHEVRNIVNPSGKFENARFAAVSWFTRKNLSQT